jgi:hypothetical protein
MHGMSGILEGDLVTRMLNMIDTINVQTLYEHGN